MNLREAIRASLGLLSRRDRFLLGGSAALQMATSVLDLAGVLLLGLIGSLAATILTGSTLPNRVREIADIAGFGNSSDVGILGALAVTAAVLLLAKSVVSPLLMARVFRFLAKREAYVSTRLTKALFSRPLSFVEQRSSQTTAFALCQAASAATITALGQMVVAVSEIALLAVLSITLLVINPGVALVAVGFFALVGAGLQRTSGFQAERFGALRTRLDIASFTLIQEGLGSYREIVVSDRRALFVDRLRRLRIQAAHAAAGTQMTALVPKYVLEGALVCGAFALGAVLFATESPSDAMGSLALFLGAATRAMPSLLRFQSSTLAIRTAAGVAIPTFELAADLGHPGDAVQSKEVEEELKRLVSGDHSDFVPIIRLLDVSYSYPGSDAPAVRGITMIVDEGQSLALVGRSGAGKSTLADLVLGVLEPDAGVVRIGGEPPAEAVHRWPGGIAYVPQEVMLADDTIRANVAFGFPTDSVDDESVWEALSRAQIADYVRRQENGLDTYVGERGLRLSGGQRQRLGIARALYTRPRLLVLDEATSALDAETEKAITLMLRELERDVTTVLIAHRLSTVRHADVVVYLEEGKSLATGTFDELCGRIPALRRQVALMGLETAPRSDNSAHDDVADS